MVTTPITIDHTATPIELNLFVDMPSSITFAQNPPPSSWQESAIKVCSIALKIIIFPWGLYELTRYCVQRILLALIYPPQNALLKKYNPLYRIEDLEEAQASLTKSLASKGVSVLPITLEKNHNRYSALLMYHNNTVPSGKWMLRCTGRMNPIERIDKKQVLSICNENVNCNLLLINAPGVGKSEGEANPETIGDAQEIGITFLENVIKARNIALVGYSFGGAALAQAIMQHNFKPDQHRYLVIREMSFDSISNVSAKMVGQHYPSVKRWVNAILKWLIKWSGCEIDATLASHRLHELGIKEVIIQAGRIKTDGTMHSEHDTIIHHHATLANRLLKTDASGKKWGKIIDLLPRANHFDHNQIQEHTLHHIQTNFLS